VTVTGTSEVGNGAPVANSLLIYVLDVSGSTGTVQATTLCGKQNVFDTDANTTLDCELLAIRNLNAAAIGAGTVAQIGFIGFAGQPSDDSPVNPPSAQILDLDRAGGQQSLIPPSLNNSAVPGAFTVYPPTSNLDWVLQGAYLDALNIGNPPGWPLRGANDGFAQFTLRDVGINTNFAAAMLRLKELLPFITSQHIQVVMISDGAATVGISGTQLQTILNTITVAPGRTLRVDTFATGSSATCGSVIPPDPINGTLAQISNKLGGTCTRIIDPNDATDAVPGAIASQLTSVAIRVNGAVTSFTLTPAVTGPGSATRSTTANLVPGDNELCASATGSDGGGAGFAPFNCIHVTAKNPPVITGGGDDPSTGFVGTVAEGSPFALSTTVADATSQSWSATGGTGTCTFADPSAASTSVTCTDDGVYTLTLAAIDNATPAQTTTLVSHLNVTNVAPDATMNVAPASVPLSAATVHAHVGMTDPGADAWSCTFDWGDLSTTTTAPSTTATCDADHTYTAPGSYSVSVHVIDGDGGSDDDLGSVTVKAPPALTGLPTDGPGGAPGGTITEGSPFAIGGTVAGASSLHWTATGGTGTCTFAADAVPTSVTCTDNGTYELTLTAVDGFGQTSTSSFHLLVTNVAPTLLVASPAAGSSPRTVTFTGNVFDPGTGDTHTCTINWGDGSPAETVAAVGGTCTAAHTYAGSVASTVITATAKDDDNAVSDIVMRALNFNRPPVCSAVAPNIAVLWPANHKLVLITLSGATDPDGGPLSYEITGVRQDEALNAAGDGDTARDAQLASGGSVWIRAERSGTGDGRVYTISFRVSDSDGASCTGSVQVSVPHSVNKPAVKTPGVNVNSLG
jgi:hypothetical protein